ncbi:protein-tyrosine phosphatase family protein [Auraticoccus monumenti]|uniref:Protein-tyrosine phosphatase n=1 Tax=Auraticoccus monumenti TaxID=675864 RepID=A0A1G6Y2S9_9ACTN|nr:protein-tyrosine phosphatase family protein [Auraticoccus monumenti]SDD84650.1 Protein-tyrosine phosphatase [Auraticoccus monumenti]
MTGWGPESGVVELPDGRRVRATGLRRPRGDVPPPDLAVYLLGRDPQVRGWPYRWVRWRDFGVPAATEDALDALREAHRRAEGERVEFACGGGVGRTGTAFAALAVLSGVDVDDAVGWVREHHHRRAVETRGQRRWLAEVAPLLHG